MVELYLAYFLIMNQANEPVGSLRSDELVSLEMCADILNSHDVYEANSHKAGLPGEFHLDQGHCDLHKAPDRGA